MRNNVIRPVFGGVRPDAVLPEGEKAAQVAVIDPLARMSFLTVEDTAAFLARLLLSGGTQEAIRHWVHHVEVVKPKIRLAGYRDEASLDRIVTAYTQAVRAAIDKRLPPHRRTRATTVRREALA
jgi:hypothetical protein